MPFQAPFPLSGVDLQRHLEALEVEMYLDVYRALPTGLAEAWGIDATELGGSLRLTAAGFDHPLFNRMLGVGLEEPPGGSGDPSRVPRERWMDLLSSTAAHYAGVGVRRWMIQLLPAMESEAFRTACPDRGVVRLRGWAKHLGPAHSEVDAPTPLRIRRIPEGDEGEEPARAWAAIVCETFGMPDAFVPWLQGLQRRDGWHLYLALDGERPVAAAALYRPRERQGGAPVPAQLGFAGTLPEARSRGAQSALVARRLADARELGLRWIAAETDETLPERPNPSYHNLVRLGLPVRYVRANWGPPKPEETSGLTSGGPPPG